MTEAPTLDLRVDIISDVVCPWCLIGYSQLKSAADSLGKTLDLHWYPFELNPPMPPEGQNLREHVAQKYGSSEEESKTTRAKLISLGAEFGFTFKFAPDSRIVNTLQAHKLIKWAAPKGRQHALKMALMQRYFTQGQDVSNPDILLATVKEVGLDPSEAQGLLKDDALSLATREEEQFWLSKGAQAVPSMVFAQRHLVTGAQGTDAYKSIIAHLTDPKAT